MKSIRERRNCAVRRADMDEEGGEMVAKEEAGIEARTGASEGCPLNEANIIKLIRVFCCCCYCS